MTTSQPPEASKALGARVRRALRATDTAEARRTASVAVFLLVAFAASRASALWINSRGAAWHLPSMIGADLLVLAGCAAAVRATASWRPVRGLVAFLLVLIGDYLVMNQMSLLFTGANLSWGTLRGDEGVTLADIQLLAPEALVAGALVLALVAAAAIVAATIGWRVAPPLLGSRRLLATLVLGGALLQGVGVLRGQGVELDHNPVVRFVGSTFSRDDVPGRSLSSAEWAQLTASRTPAVERAPPPRLDPAKRPKNAVLWVAEGIPLELTTLGGSPLDTTPNLRRRADAGGLQFTRWYATFHKSIHALFSIACSEYPSPFRLAITMTKPRIDCGSMMETLRDAGFAQGLFHGGFFSFADKLALFGGRGFDTMVDAMDLREGGKTKWRSTKWGIDDRAMADRMLSWVDGVPRDRRFFAVAIPIAPHYPRDVPADAERIVEPVDDASKYKNAVRFSDAAFERFMQGMEARGLLEDTVVFYLADHGEYLQQPERPSPGDRQVYEANLHVPAVMFHPASFPTAMQTDRLGGHVDVAPTLLSLLGVQPDPKNRGQSLFAPDFTQRRVFLQAYQNETSTIGIVDGDTKYVWNMRTGDTEVYDLRADPQELHDLTDEREAAADAAGEDASTFRGAQLARLAEYPVLQEDDLEQQVFEAAGFDVMEGDTAVPCDARPDARGRRGCSAEPSAGIFIARVVVAGLGRDCIAVDVPAKKTVRLTVQGPAMARMTSVRAAFPDAVKLTAPEVKLEGLEGTKSAGKYRITTRQRDKTVHIPETARAAGAFSVTLSSAQAVPVCFVLSGSNWW